MNYHQQMRHPLWQQKRLEVLNLHGFQCQQCDDNETTLHVHHPYYKPNAMIWDYDNEELECLCEKCHKDAHVVDELVRKTLAFATVELKNQVIGYLNKMRALDTFGNEVLRTCKTSDTYFKLENIHQVTGACLGEYPMLAENAVFLSTQNKRVNVKDWVEVSKYGTSKLLETIKEKYKVVKERKNG
jgi:protein-arginine kinase activator protein McsA